MTTVKYSSVFLQYNLIKENEKEEHIYTFHNSTQIDILYSCIQWS